METIQFGKAYEAGLPRTKRFLLSLGFHHDSAMDLAQAAWGRAWERKAQLRDETRLLSWVNTIALNEARRSMRNSRQTVSFSVPNEPTATLDTAAIDLAKILELCEPEDREVLQAQLRGMSSVELAEEKGVSATAIRIRSFRARRAARELCEPAVPVGSVLSNPDAARMQKLQQTFRANQLAFARRHLELATTFVRLLEMVPEGDKQDRLLKLIEKSTSNALRSLSRIAEPNGEVTLIRSAALGMQQRVLSFAPRKEKDMARRASASAA